MLVGIIAAAAVVVILLAAGVIRIGKGTDTETVEDTAAVYTEEPSADVTLIPEQTVVPEDTGVQETDYAAPEAAPPVAENSIPEAGPVQEAAPVVDTAQNVPPAAETQNAEVTSDEEEASAYTPAESYITVINGIQAPAENFIFPYSSQSLLSYDELSVLERSDRDSMHDYSQLAINEIFARYGYSFTRTGSSSAQLARETFEGRSWYQEAQQYCPVNDQETLKLSYMNDIERQNIKLIDQWQMDHGVYY